MLDKLFPNYVQWEALPMRWTCIRRITRSLLPALLVGLGLIAFSGRVDADDPPRIDANAKAAQDNADRYGDPLPHGAVGRLGSVRFRHPAMIMMLAVTPNGKQAITLSQQSSVLRSCDLESGQVTEFMDLGPNFAAVASNRQSTMVFTDSGKRLVIAAANSVQVIDVEKKTTVWKPEAQPGVVNCSAVSPDGKWVALVQSHNNGRLMIYNAATGALHKEIPKPGNSPTNVAFTHDSKTVSVTTHNSAEGLRSWNVDSGDELPRLKEIQSSAIALAYSPDGKWLALGHLQQAVSLYDLKERKLRHTFAGYQSSLRWLDFSADSSRLFAFDGVGNLGVLDTEQGKELRRIPAGPSQAFPVLIPEANAVLTSSANVVDLWNFETGEPVHPHDGHRSVVNHVAVSPDGRLAATFGQENTLRLWDLATAEQLHVRRRSMYGPATVAFTPDSQQLLWANSPISIEFLDVAVLKKKENAAATVRETRGSQFATFVVSEDGKTLLANNSQSGGAQVWDLTQKDPAVTNISPTFGANGIPLAYSPDTRLSATQFTVDGSGRQLVIADLLRGREVTRLVSPPGQQIVQGAFAGTRLFALRGVRQIALWDVLSGKSVVNINVESSANTTAVACSADGRLLAWAESDNDRTIRLYDALNGRELGKFSGHIGDVVFLRMHLDGNRPLLLSGSKDSTVLVWDLREVMELVAQNDTSAVRPARRTGLGGPWRRRRRRHAPRLLVVGCCRRRSDADACRKAGARSHRSDGRGQGAGVGGANGQ